MTVQGNIGIAADPEDITIGELLAFLKATPQAPLVFSRGGQDVKPGYHVTEVKAGRFEALDCGGNPEAWTEMFVQLWDVNEDEGRTHMPAGLFVKIIGKVVEHVALDMTAKLTFEVSDGERPMQLHRAAMPSVQAGIIRVALSSRPSSCKPRDRWLKEKQATACCAPAASKPCCG